MNEGMNTNEKSAEQQIQKKMNTIIGKMQEAGEPLYISVELPGVELPGAVDIDLSHKHLYSYSLPYKGYLYQIKCSPLEKDGKKGGWISLYIDDVYDPKKEELLNNDGLVEIKPDGFASPPPETRALSYTREYNHESKTFKEGRVLSTHKRKPDDPSESFLVKQTKEPAKILKRLDAVEQLVNEAISKRERQKQKTSQKIQALLGAKEKEKDLTPEKIAKNIQELLQKFNGQEVYTDKYWIGLSTKETNTPGKKQSLVERQTLPNINLSDLNEKEAEGFSIRYAEYYGNIEARLVSPNNTGEIKEGLGDKINKMFRRKAKRRRMIAQQYDQETKKIKEMNKKLQEEMETRKKSDENKKYFYNISTKKGGLYGEYTDTRRIYQRSTKNKKQELTDMKYTYHAPQALFTPEGLVLKLLEVYKDLKTYLQEHKQDS